MSNYDVISKVTAQLKNRLQTMINEVDPKASLTLVRPNTIDTSGDKRGINLYLYQVTPNASLRNMTPVVSKFTEMTNSAGLVEKVPTQATPKIALDLYYLFTFFGDGQSEIQQKLLAAVIAGMEANPRLSIVNENNLNDDIQLSLISLNLEAITKIWSTFFQTPYQISLAYEATSVELYGTPVDLAKPVLDPKVLSNLKP